MFQFISLISVIVLVIFLCAVKFKKNENVKNYKLPPGPKPSMLIGNTWFYLMIPDFHCLLKEVENLMGSNKITYAKILVIGRVIACGKAEYVKALMTNKDCINKSELFYEKMIPISNGLITTSGEQWRHHRKLLNPVFNSRKLNTFTQVFSKVSYDIVSDLQKLADGKSFEICHTFGKRFFYSIVETMCDVDDPLALFPERYVEDFLNKMQREMNHVTESYVKFFTFPIRKLFYHNITAKRFIKQTEEIIDKIIRETKSVKFDKIEGEGEKNFLDRAIELPHKDFIGEMRTIIIAGIDSTVTTPSFICLMFALHSKYQELAYKEVMEILGDTNREITPQDLSEMKLLEACIYETLRLFPTVPLVARRLTADVPLGEYEAPEGTHVVVLLTTLHRDPEQWEKPDEFYPEHFEPEKVKKRHPYAFIPFAAGLRQCLGYRYAMVQLKTTIANVLRNFRIETDMKITDIRMNRVPSVDPTQFKVKLTKRIN